MKKLINLLIIVNFFILFTIIIMVLVNNCHAQWLPDVRLSYTDSNSVTCEASKEIASTGNYVHAVWADSRNGYPLEIYYKRSTDKGINWGPDTRFSTDMKDSYYPSIVVSGSVVHVIWYKHVAIPQGFYYKRSTDNGLTWNSETPLIISQGNVFHPYLLNFSP